MAHIADFDPDDVGLDNGNYFGMPFTPDEADLVLISAPWEVTASYGGGAAYAPDAIIEASTQLDFYEAFAPDEWKRGIATAEIDYSIQDLNMVLRDDARRVMEHLGHGGKTTDESVRRKIERINNASADINARLYTQAAEWLDRGKIVGMVGGDHSTPYGLIQAVSQRFPQTGILHFDAHCDLREAYEGFRFSHASIMYNVLHDLPGVSGLVQVGVRDYCSAEARRAAEDPRVTLFSDRRLCEKRFSGSSWTQICTEIAERLPEQVYISFDIDALQPQYCPGTGTPVPGGLDFNEAVHLIECVAGTGRRIVGFDLSEVAPSKESQWDANVGARMLWKLCVTTLKTNSNANGNRL